MTGPTPNRQVWGWASQWGSLFASAAIIVVLSLVLALVLTPWFWIGVAFGLGAFVALIVLYRRSGPPPKL